MAQINGDDFKKNIAFPEGNELFAGDFRTNLDEENADMVQFTKRWNWKWIVQHQGYFCRKFEATSWSIFQSSRLVSHVHNMMTGQNVKKKCLICQIQIKMLKQHATPSSSLHNLKMYSSKGCREATQR